MSIEKFFERSYYWEDADIVYIRFPNNPNDASEPRDCVDFLGGDDYDEKFFPNHVFDMKMSGKIQGIEILNASHYYGDAVKLLPRLEDRVKLK